jgi:hypothetical protein
VQPEDLEHVLPRLVPKKASAEAAALDAAADEDEAWREVRLAAADMQRLRLMQQAHARLFEQQRRRVRVASEK